MIDRNASFISTGPVLTHLEYNVTSDSKSKIYVNMNEMISRPDTESKKEQLIKKA